MIRLYKTQGAKSSQAVPAMEDGDKVLLSPTKAMQKRLRNAHWSLLIPKSPPTLYAIDWHAFAGGPIMLFSEYLHHGSGSKAVLHYQTKVF